VLNEFEKRQLVDWTPKFDDFLKHDDENRTYDDVFGTYRSECDNYSTCVFPHAIFAHSYESDYALLSRVRLYSRIGNDLTRRFSLIVEAIATFARAPASSIETRSLLTVRSLTSGRMLQLHPYQLHPLRPAARNPPYISPAGSYLAREVPR
jgi:hypothetical protein